MLFGQQKELYTTPFVSGADTVGTLTTADSVYVLLAPGGTWNLLTQSVNDTAMITADDKGAGTTVQFILANESYWTHANKMQFKIQNTGQDTVTSGWINTGIYRGSFTLDIIPDTTGHPSYVDYSQSILHGN